MARGEQRRSECKVKTTVVVVGRWRARCEGDAGDGYNKYEGPVR